jgi:hypothetical protein
MSTKNIVNLTVIGGLLLFFSIAGFANPIWFVPDAGVAIFVPEVISELE